MKLNLNFSSFIASIVCIGLFFIAATSEWIVRFFLIHVSVHPISIVLILTVICFFTSLLGMKDWINRITMFRSIVSIGVTLTLAFIIGFILIIGGLVG